MQQGGTDAPAKIRIEDARRTGSLADRPHLNRDFPARRRAFVWRSNRRNSPELPGGSHHSRPPDNHTAGKGELWMVENVEELGSELKGEAFGEFRILGDREIYIPEPGTVNRVASKVTKGINTVVRLPKCERIDVAIGRIPRQNLVHSRNHVWPLMEINPTVACDYTDGLARHDCDDRVPLPAGSQSFRQSAPNRNGIGQCGGPTMPGIKGRRPLLCFQIIRVLWKRGGGEIEVNTVRSAIKRF